MMVSFAEWSETVETEFTCEFAGDGIRDVYTTPWGVKVHDEQFIPRHWGRKPYSRTMVDRIYPASDEQRLKKEYGCTLDYERYTEDGFGYPMFKGDDSLEQAYNFIQKELDKGNN